MTLFISGTLIIAGFLLLIYGADWLVSGASSLAKKNNISDLAIGLTIVAFGTSAPELVVNLVASTENQSDIVLGNVIGSNNFNLYVILGIVALIAPISVQSTTVWREIPISLFAAIFLFFLGSGLAFKENLSISRLDGILLFILFLGFLYYVFKQLKTDNLQQSPMENELSTFQIWVFIVFGLAGLVSGGKLVVDNAIEMAENFGVSKKIIGLTIVAAGTSLPELVTSVVAAQKKNSDIAIGNVIGSNIFNILLILSLSSLVSPIDYNLAFNKDVFLLMGGTVFLFVAMFTGERKKLDRWEGGVLLLIFLAYTLDSIFSEI